MISRKLFIVFYGTALCTYVSGFWGIAFLLLNRKFSIDTERTLVYTHQVYFHIVTPAKYTLTNRASRLSRMQILMEHQRHRMLETLPTNSTSKQ